VKNLFPIYLILILTKFSKLAKNILIILFPITLWHGQRTKIKDFSDAISHHLKKGFGIRVFSYLMLGSILFACSKNNIKYSYPSDPEIERNSRAGKFFGEDIILYGAKPLNKIVIKQNSNKLFISAHEVIAEIMEIDIVDEEMGIISSKWQFNKDRNSKTKINILIRNNKTSKDNIDISIYKKYLGKDKKWHDRKSDNNQILINLLKEKIILRTN
jgi:hypothetical protein